MVPARPGRHREAGLGSVERLDLGFLVEAENDGPLGRVHVQPDHVDQLLFEAGVVRDLETALLSMALARGRARCGRRCPCPPRVLGQRARRPMGGTVRRQLLLGHPHDLGHRALGQPRAPAPTFGDNANPGNAFFLEPPPPARTLSESTPERRATSSFGTPSAAQSKALAWRTARCGNQNRASFPNGTGRRPTGPKARLLQACPIIAQAISATED